LVVKNVYPGVHGEEGNRWPKKRRASSGGTKPQKKRRGAALFKLEKGYYQLGQKKKTQQNLLTSGKGSSVKHALSPSPESSPKGGGLPPVERTLLYKSRPIKKKKSEKKRFTPPRRLAGGSFFSLRERFLSRERTEAHQGTALRTKKKGIREKRRISRNTSPKRSSSGRRSP